MKRLAVITILFALAAVTFEFVGGSDPAPARHGPAAR